VKCEEIKHVAAVIWQCICSLDLFQYLPPEVGLLQPVINLLYDWCRALSTFPVVTWTSFVEYIRSRVNLLATEEHIRELVNQLVVTGEVGSTHNSVNVS